MTLPSAGFAEEWLEVKKAEIGSNKIFNFNLESTGTNSLSTPFTFEPVDNECRITGLMIVDNQNQ